MAGSEVWAEFQHLIAYAPYRALMGPFLERNFDVRLEGDGPATRLVGADGRPIDPAALHARIRADSHKRDGLYNIAMTLRHDRW